MIVCRSYTNSTQLHTVVNGGDYSRTHAPCICECSCYANVLHGVVSTAFHHRRSNVPNLHRRTKNFEERVKRRMSHVGEDIVVTKSNYDDFSIPCPWRNFEVIVGEHVMYLNAGWLAELSPFFASFCFGETEREPFIIDDVKYEELLEFFRCIFFCPTRKSITAANVSLIIRLSTKFDMRPVMARCELFVARTAPTFDRQKLFQVTCALSACDPNCSTMTLLVDKLANMEDEELEQLQFHRMPGEVVAEVYSHKLRKQNSKKKWCCIM